MLRFDSTLVVRDTIRAQNDVRVDGNLYVTGESYFNNALNVNTIKYGNGAVTTTFTPATAGFPARWDLIGDPGPGGEPPMPAPPCIVPSVPLINTINGVYNSYGYVSSNPYTMRR